MNEIFILTSVGLSILAVILATSKLRINAFYSLVTVSVILAVVVNGPAKSTSILMEGFGNTVGSIGLIIVFGTTLGVFLDKSGATLGMAAFILRFIRKEKSARSMAITGTIAGLPIFCDSGFIVLSGLNRSISKSSGISLPRMAASLAISLYTLHCFVPPHPGITAATGILGGSVGKMIPAGLLVAVPGVVVGYLWVKYRSSRLNKDEKHLTEEMEHPVAEIPGAFRSFFPVILPLLLISLNSLDEIIHFSGETWLTAMTGFAGKPYMALFLGIISVFLLMPGSLKSQTDKFLAEGVEKSGSILLITAAGGTFGAVIRASGLGDIIQSFLSQSHAGILVPYLLALFLKTAQGSSTVAAITAASIVAPMLSGLSLDSEQGRMFALLALGAGTMAVSHTNDSYFWVITKFSGFSPKITLRLFSTASLVVSVSCMLMITILSFL